MVDDAKKRQGRLGIGGWGEDAAVELYLSQPRFLGLLPSTQTRSMPSTPGSGLIKTSSLQSAERTNEKP